MLQRGLYMIPLNGGPIIGPNYSGLCMSINMIKSLSYQSSQYYISYKQYNSYATYVTEKDVV